MSARLAGLHAVVTGGGTGLGFAIARAMATEGARVTLVGRRAEVLDRAVAQIGDGAAREAGDVGDLGAVPDLAARIARRGPVDVLVNNAGTHHKAPALDTTDADIAHVVGVNLFGTFALTREIGRGMAASGRGSVIMITSMAAILGLPSVPSYAASKAALAGLVRQLAVEFGPAGVRVNAIAPGFVETDMNRDIFAADPERLARVLGRTPLGRLGEPADVAGAAVYLASAEARFVTGVCLPVDGGMSIGF